MLDTMCPTCIAPVGHNQRCVIHGDTPMHLFLTMIAFSGVVGGVYGLVITVRG